MSSEKNFFGKKNYTYCNSTAYLKVIYSDIPKSFSLFRVYCLPMHNKNLKENPGRDVLWEFLCLGSFPYIIISF